MENRPKIESNFRRSSMLRFSIGTKLTITFLALVIIPMSATAYYNLIQSRYEVIKLAQENLIELSRSTAYPIEQLIAENQRTSATLAGDPLVAKFLAASEQERQALTSEVYKTLQNFVDTHPDYDSPGLLDVNGIVVAALTDILVGKDRSFRDYFKASIQGKPYISDILVGRATKRPGVFLTNPVISTEGEIVGINLIWLKADTIWNIIDDVLVGKEGIAYLVDQDGVIIAHPNRDRLYHSLGELTSEAVSTISSTIRFGTIKNTKSPVIPKPLGMDQLSDQLTSAQGSGNYRYYSPLDHRYHVVGYTPLSIQPWTVVVDLPEAQFLAPLEKMRTVAWVSVGLVTVITFIISIMLVRGIIRPIRRLTDVAAAVERNQPFEPSDIEDLTMGHDEISHLGRVFSGMVLSLRESENKYQDLFDNAPDMFCSVDAKTTNILECNQTLAKVLDYTKEEVIGRSIFDMYAPDSAEHSKSTMFPAFLKTGTVQEEELQLQRKDGSTIDVSLNVSAIRDEKGKILQSRSAWRDITKRKQAEEALRKERDRAQMYLDIAGVMFVALNAEGDVKLINKKGCEILGYDEKEILGTNWFDSFVPEKNREKVKGIFQQIVKGEMKAAEHYENPVVNSAGLERMISWHNTLLANENGEISGTFSSGEDITHRKQAEKERVLLSTAVEQAAESVIISDRPGTIQYVNPAFERLSGFSREEIIGQNFRILKSDKHDEAFYKEMYDIISRGNIWAGRITNRMKDGTHREFETRISPVHDSSGKIINFVSVNRDVTQEVALEAHFQQSQKIQSIGTLAGGIAHDFNNILYPIIGYTEMAIDDVPEDSLTKRNLGEVLKATKRARDLVQQILTFSRQSDRELKPLKVQSIVKEAMQLLRASIPSTIIISQNIDNDCGAIRGDQTQIHQIIMNLCTNAYQTMEETGGQLELSLDEITIGPDKAIYKVDMEPGKYARLTVSDTGHGMEPAVLARIFDPYFTTKEPGKGTGLGLSVVHGIVNTHGGHISASSEPGKGTKFDVYLPLFESAEIEAETVSSETIATGDEHILLVDDENLIVDVVRQMLERLGYQVTVRTSSVEALGAFRASPDKFDLVITDLTMPNMTGDKLSQELMNIRSDIPIILCTGFSEKMSAERANASGLKGFLMKPVIINALAKTVREVLDKS